MKRDLKIAIVHDVFIEFGGAERVLLALTEIYPEADIFIPLLSNDKRELLIDKKVGKIYTAWFNKFPLIHSASILLKPLLYWYFESLDLKKYDLVISSSHSFSSKAVITSPDTLHVSYIHTPPRYLYTEFNETQIIKKPFFKTILQPLLSWLRTKDFIAAQRPDILIANSKTVQKRIKKYYRRESMLVHPPINLSKIDKKNNKSKKYYLCLSRLAKQKGIDLAIKACNKLKLPLVIVGTGSEEKYLKSMAGPTIQFKGFVADDRLEKIYARARAMIYCSIEEDFGMAPVEALAYGIPIISYKSGGAAETVTNKTGVFFEDHSVDSLARAIKKFEKKKILKSDCVKQAKKFSKKQFKTKFKKIIAKNIESNCHEK